MLHRMKVFVLSHSVIWKLVPWVYLFLNVTEESNFFWVMAWLMKNDKLLLKQCKWRVLYRLKIAQESTLLKKMYTGTLEQPLNSTSDCFCFCGFLEFLFLQTFLLIDIVFVTGKSFLFMKNLSEIFSCIQDIYVCLYCFIILWNIRSGADKRITCSMNDSS